MVATETVSAASLLLRLQTAVSLEQNCREFFFFLFLFGGSPSLIKKNFGSWTFKELLIGYLKRDLLTVSLIFCLFHLMSCCISSQLCWKTCLSSEFCRLAPESKSSLHLGGIFIDTVHTFLPSGCACFFFSVRESPMYFSICIIFRANYFILE